MGKTIVSAAFALIACTLAAPAQGQQEIPDCEDGDYWIFAGCYVGKIQKPQMACNLSREENLYRAFCSEDPNPDLIPHCSGNLDEQYEVLVCILGYLDDGAECRVAIVRIDESLVGYAAQCGGG